MSYNLPKPWKYKEWLTWPNTAIDNMNYNRVGCADTINGVCYNNTTVKECIDKSTDGFGYHVQFKNGNSICVPLRTSLYPSLNVIYKLRNQEIHPELNNVSISTFINTDKYNFPPLQSDIFFYLDIFQLRNEESKLFLSSTNLNNNYIEFLPESEYNLNIQIIPVNAFAPQIANYEKILYNEEFSIIITGTSLFLAFDNLTGNFKWVESNIKNNNNYFKIIPLKTCGYLDTKKYKFILIILL